MPYKSRAQAGKFHEMLKRGQLSKKVVDEWDSASKGLKLPYKVGKAKKKRGG
jgi:hypothetical protein